MIKAIRFEKTGGSDVLQYVDYDLPAPAKGQVQVKHTAIGVNFIDTYHRTGLYALPLPSGLGSEAAVTQPSRRVDGCRHCGQMAA